MTGTKWPDNGIEFNTWYKNVTMLTLMMANAQGFWIEEFELKYLQIRVDTRNSQFTVIGPGGANVDPGHVADVIQRYLGKYGTPQQIANHVEFTTKLLDLE